MKKVFYLVVGIVLSLLILVSLYTNYSFGQSSTTGTPDSYTITLTGSSLNSTKALNITFDITGGQAELESSFTLQATGATILLPSVDLVKKIITVVFNGSPSDGKVVISGKLKAGSVSGAPVLSVVKVARDGDVDLTSGLTIEASFSQAPASTPTPTPTPEGSPTPTPTPSATPTPSPTPVGQSLRITGPDEIELTDSGLNLSKFFARQTGFKSFTRCTVSSSESFLKLRPKKIILGGPIKKKRIIGKISLRDALDLIDEEFEGTVTVSVSCKNGLSATKEVTVSTSEE